MINFIHYKSFGGRDIPAAKAAAPDTNAAVKPCGDESALPRCANSSIGGEAAHPAICS